MKNQEITEIIKDAEINTTFFAAIAVHDPNNAAQILNKYPKITSLTFESASKLDSLALETLSTVLAENTTLEKIVLNHIHMGNKGVATIAQALIKNTTLKHIELQDNNIDYRGIKIIDEAIENNTTLLEVTCTNNNNHKSGYAYEIRDIRLHNFTEPNTMYIDHPTAYDEFVQTIGQSNVETLLNYVEQLDKTSSEYALFLKATDEAQTTEDLTKYFEKLLGVISLDRDE